MRATEIFALAVVLSCSVFVQATVLRPGKYEASLQLSIMGESEPAERDEQCFTADELRQLDRWLASHMGDGCSISDRKSIARTVTFTINCQEDGRPVTTRAELATGPDSFEATLRTTVDAGEPVESVIAITATRIGECDPQ